MLPISIIFLTFETFSLPNSVTGQLCFVVSWKTFCHSKMSFSTKELSHEILYVMHKHLTIQKQNYITKRTSLNCVNFFFNISSPFSRNNFHNSKWTTTGSIVLNVVELKTRVRYRAMRQYTIYLKSRQAKTFVQ